MTFALVESLNFGLGHLVRAAHARGHGLHLLTADRSRYATEFADPSTAYITVTEADTDDVDTVVAALRAIPDLTGVIRMTDQWSAQALAAAQRLGLPHEDAGAVALLRDKGRLRAHLHEHGFSAATSVVFDPRDADPAGLGRSLPFPCVVKDVSGSGSRNVWLLSTPADLPAVLAAAVRTGGGALTAEPYFQGPMYSAETLSWGSETRLLGVTSRVLSAEPHFREEAGSFPVAFPSGTQKEIAEWISGILRSTGYHEGFTHTEFIVTVDGFEIVEINPRLGGALTGESIRRSLGVDVHDAFFDLASGQRPALMDQDLTPRSGTAQVAVYAPVTGLFEGFTGERLLSAQPGDPVLFPLRQPGDRITATMDQRGGLALVLAAGDTAELALHRAMSAAGKIGVRMTADAA